MRPYKILLLLTVCLSLIVCAAQGQRRISQERSEAQDSSRSQGRLMPPATLSCDINNTTSFTGRVLSYSRSSRRIFLRMHTDEATNEQFTIALARGQDASAKYLFKGETFKQGDWRKIETGRNRLRPGMRATVWACYVNGEPKAELVDWRPGEGRSNSVY
jgi:hypothetical protein